MRRSRSDSADNAILPLNAVPNLGVEFDEALEIAKENCGRNYRGAAATLSREVSRVPSTEHECAWTT